MTGKIKYIILLLLSASLVSACAFGGYELVMKAYDMAIENGYRFGCYGDAMLILDD